MKITIIYDNETLNSKYQADWGFSCLIETGDKKILFDTGAKGEILLSNMKKMNIDPSIVDEIFISHFHWDHTGGLEDFLKKHAVKVYMPRSFKTPDYLEDFVVIDDFTKIHENIYSTGEINNIEQSLLIKTKEGVVIIVGCAHSDLKNILKIAKKLGNPIACIGGFHGFSDIEKLKNLKLICPTHCTEHKEEIKNTYPEKFISGGVSRLTYSNG